MTQEQLEKLAKYKEAFAAETDPETKAKFKKRIDALEEQLANEEKAVVKEEKHVEEKETKELSAIEKKLERYRQAVKDETDPDTRARFQQRVDSIEEQLGIVRKEIKEEKAVVAEHKEEVAKAVKEVAHKEPAKVKKSKAIKKAVKSTAERKKVVASKKKRSNKLVGILAQLDKLINSNKELKKRYKGHGVDLERDAARGAKPFGYRFVGKGDYRDPEKVLSPEAFIKAKKKGIIDFENRPNRSDKYGAKGVKAKGHPKLAEGGEIDGYAKGGKLFNIDKNEDEQRIAKPMGWRWKDSAIKAGIIKKSDLYKTPSKANIEKHPTHVYKEERVQKSDKKPSHKYLSLGKGGKLYNVDKNEDEQRIAKPMGWRWKDSAIKAGIIKKSDLYKVPSAANIEKYPKHVYKEERVQKSDKKPSHKYTSL